MKKFQLFALSIVASAVLIGCGSSNNAGEKSAGLRSLGNQNDTETVKIQKTLKDLKVQLKESGCSYNGDSCEELQTRINALEGQLKEKEAEAQKALQEAQEAKAKLESMQGCSACLKKKAEELKKLVLHYATPEVAEFLKDKDGTISSIIVQVRQDLKDTKTNLDAVKKECDNLDKNLDAKMVDYDKKLADEQAAVRADIISIANGMISDLRDSYDPIKAQLDAAEAKDESAAKDEAAKKKYLDELLDKAGKGADAVEKLVTVESEIKAIKESINDEIKALMDQDPKDYTALTNLQKQLEEKNKEKAALLKTKCEGNVTVEQIMAAKKAYDEAVVCHTKTTKDVTDLKAAIDPIRTRIKTLEVAISNVTKNPDSVAEVNSLVEAIKTECQNKVAEAQSAYDSAVAAQPIADELEHILYPDLPTGATGAAGAGD